MEKNLKKVLYVIIAIGLLLISDYLVIKPLFSKNKGELLNPNVATPTIIETKLLKNENLYSKYETINENIELKSQEWYQINLKSNCIIKFQYSNKTSELSKLNLYVNDTKIENDEEFYEYDKFNINFHLYEDTLVIEHNRSYNHPAFIKIIDLTTGNTRNLANTEDFFITSVIVDEYGITASYSRLTSSLNYYLDNSETKLTFKALDKDINIDICDKNTWEEDIKNLDYVAFDMNYIIRDNKLDLNNPDISNLQNFDLFIKPHTKRISEICKINN